MKKIILAFVLISSVSGASYAQNQHAVPPPPPAAGGQMPNATQMAESRAQVMKTQFNLSDAQYKKTVAIETDFFEQQAKLRASGTPPRPEVMREMHEQKAAKYKQVLNSDQYAKFEAGMPKFQANHAAPNSTTAAPNASNTQTASGNGQATISTQGSH